MANAGDLRKGLFFSGRSDFGIRPKPNVVLKSGAKFVLCNGSFCRGEKCTFAHSPEEMQLWNAELQSDSYGMIQALMCPIIIKLVLHY